MATTAHRELHAPVPSDGYVQSFARGLEVIRSFSADAPEQTLSEVAARSGLTRAGARRFLLTLQTLAYVEGDGKHYRLTPRILDLGFAYLTSMPIWNLAEPVMEALVWLRVPGDLVFAAGALLAGLHLGWVLARIDRRSGQNPAHHVVDGIDISGEVDGSLPPECEAASALVVAAPVCLCRSTNPSSMAAVNGMPVPIT